VAAVSPSTDTVNEGVVSFVVRNSSGAAAGPAVSGAVSKGSASASFPSGGLAIGTYSITVTYADNIALPNWNSSTGALVGTLTIK
jgi:hypothetical protein